MFLILYLNNKKIMTLSDRVRHFFHVVSNIRPVVWIGLYVALTPVFALIYICGCPTDNSASLPEEAPTSVHGYIIV